MELLNQSWNHLLSSLSLGKQSVLLRFLKNGVKTGTDTMFGSLSCRAFLPLLPGELESVRPRSPSLLVSFFSINFLEVLVLASLYEFSLVEIGFTLIDTVVGQVPGIQAPVFHSEKKKFQC